MSARALDSFQSAARLQAWNAAGAAGLGRRAGFVGGRRILEVGAGQAVLVTDGLVKVTVRDPDAPGPGRATARGESLLSLRGSGDLIGEEAAVGGLAASGAGAVRPTAFAVTYVRARVFPVAELARFLEGNAAGLMLVARGMAERLAEAQAQVVASTRDNADRRLARLLCDLHRYASPEPGAVVPVSLTKAELASWIGVSRETAGRALRRWRERGLVETGQYWVRVCDPAALARIAGYADGGRPAARPEPAAA